MRCRHLQPLGAPAGLHLHLGSSSLSSKALQLLVLVLRRHFGFIAFIYYTETSVCFLKLLSGQIAADKQCWPVFLRQPKFITFLLFIYLRSRGGVAWIFLRVTVCKRLYFPIQPWGWAENNPRAEQLCNKIHVKVKEMHWDHVGELCWDALTLQQWPKRVPLVRLWHPSACCPNRNAPCPAALHRCAQMVPPFSKGCFNVSCSTAESCQPGSKGDAEPGVFPSHGVSLHGSLPKAPWSPISNGNKWVEPSSPAFPLFLQWDRRCSVGNEERTAFPHWYQSPIQREVVCLEGRGTERHAKQKARSIIGQL